MTKITYIPGEIANAAIDEHGNREPVTRTQHIFDDAKGKSQAEVNADIDNALALHQSEINALDSQNYATVGTFSELPATGSVDTIYRVSNWDGSANSGAGAVDATVYSEYAWDDSNSEYKLLDVKTAVGEVFDISLYHASGGVLAEYADLAAALGTDGANVPASVRRGGMSVKFVCSSDNKYVQYRLISESFNTILSNWHEEGVVYDGSEIPNADLSFSDERGNAIVVFNNGGIKTKNFDSSEDATTSKRGLMSAIDKIALNNAIIDIDNIGTYTLNSTDTDLEFSDENKYKIVEFKEGHIITKNFDSRNLITKSLAGKKYSIVGDSISTYSGYLPSNVPGYTGATYVNFYPNGTNDVNSVDKTWWKIMEKETGLTLMRNCSWSGSEVEGDSTATDTAIAGCSDRRITDISDGVNAPDIIIVYMGLNDMFKSETLGTWTPNDAIPSEGVIDNFTSAYALMLHKIINSYKDAEVYCCSIIENPYAAIQKGKSNYPTRNSNDETINEYNRAIKDICLGVGANFIDIHSCGMTYWNDSETQLGGHPTSKGMSMIGKYISKKVLSLTKLKY